MRENLQSVIGPKMAVSEKVVVAAAERAEDAARIEVFAAALQANADVLKGLERTMTKKLGVTVRHAESETVIPPRTNLAAYVRTRRTHTKHWLEIAGAIDPRWAGMVRNGRLAVFLKAGPSVSSSPLEAVVKKAKHRSFRVPHFFGAFEADGLNIGVWEFVDGTRIPFEELSLATQTKLVRAIAELNCIDASGVVAPKTKWVTAPLAWYERRFSKLGEQDRLKWQSAMERVRAILAHEDIVGTIIRGQGERFLTHYDINPNNVFTEEDREIVIFDWEGATLSVPGADLRFLARLEHREALLAAYVARAQELGLKLDTNDVRRAYEMIEGFRMIYKGWASKSLNAVQRGLDIVSAYIDPQDKDAKPTSKQAPRETEKMTKKTSVSPSENRPLGRGVIEASAELKAKIKEYVEEKGQLYAKIDHPSFAALPARWGSERFDLIAPHLDHKGGTALDIGSHWGYMAHRLEDLGYTVTANEHSPKHLYFLKELRDISGKKFDIVSGSIFDLENPDFDVVLALNIFHHFLKTDERFENLNKFLSRLKCRTMIYQGHRPKERAKLDTSGHFMEAPEMARFIADKLSLSKVIPIGIDSGREIFKLTN